MEKGKFYSRYRDRNSFRFVAAYLIEEEGWKCKDIVKWLIGELKNCQTPLSVKKKKFRPMPDTASLLVYMGSILRDWVYNLTRCVGKVYKLYQVCNCFPRVSRDVAKIDLHRLKDIMCYLKKNNCIHPDDFVDLEKLLLKTCSKFNR